MPKNNNNHRIIEERYRKLNNCVKKGSHGIYSIKDWLDLFGTDDESQMSKWLNGKVAMPDKYIQIMAHTFGCREEYLTGKDSYVTRYDYLMRYEIAEFKTQIDYMNYIGINLHLYPYLYCNPEEANTLLIDVENERAFDDSDIRKRVAKDIVRDKDSKKYYKLKNEYSFFHNEIEKNGVVFDTCYDSKRLIQTSTKTITDQERYIEKNGDLEIHILCEIVCADKTYLIRPLQMSNLLKTLDLTYLNTLKTMLDSGFIDCQQALI